MKKLLMLILTVLLNVGINQAMLVDIPKAQILQQRFAGTMFQHFSENTDLISQLAEREVNLVSVFNAVSAALEQYKEDLKERAYIAGLLEDCYLDIIEIILKDSPEGFKALKEIIAEFEKD